MITVRFFAGARDAAGCAQETATATTVGGLRSVLTEKHTGLAGVLPRCTVLVDGVRRDDDAPLAGATTVDVLPPFAGG